MYFYVQGINLSHSNFGTLYTTTAFFVCIITSR